MTSLLCEMVILKSDSTSGRVKTGKAPLIGRLTGLHIYSNDYALQFAFDLSCMALAACSVYRSQSEYRLLMCGGATSPRLSQRALQLVNLCHRGAEH